LYLPLQIKTSNVCSNGYYFFQKLDRYDTMLVLLHCIGATADEFLLIPGYLLIQKAVNIPVNLQQSAKWSKFQVAKQDLAGVCLDIRQAILEQKATYTFAHENSTVDISNIQLDTRSRLIIPQSPYQQREQRFYGGWVEKFGSIFSIVRGPAGAQHDFIMDGLRVQDKVTVVNAVNITTGSRRLPYKSTNFELLSTEGL